MCLTLRSTKLNAQKKVAHKLFRISKSAFLYFNNDYDEVAVLKAEALEMIVKEKTNS